MMQEKKIVKRYPNRKLYDPDKSCYITLDHVAEMVKGGQDIKVIDSATGEDLTELTLAQVILGEEKKNRREPRSLRDFYQKRVAESVSNMRGLSQRAFEALELWQGRVEERMQQSMTAINKAAQAASEIKNLRKTIHNLEKRISALESTQKNAGPKRKSV